MADAGRCHWERTSALPLVATPFALGLSRGDAKRRSRVHAWTAHG